MKSNAALTEREQFPWRTVVAALSIAALVGIALRSMGRELLSDSGFGVWTGAWTPDTSQWLADPYSFSHVLHGVIFYAVLFPFRRWLSVGQRLLIAMLIEGGWEVLENSPVVIDRYRTATASLDYYGDSVLNSLADLACAVLGFWLAWRFDWKWILLLAVVIELSMLYFIRDNLTLNVLMLIYPLDAIREWQAGL